MESACLGFAHNHNPSTWETEAEGFQQFEASLGYRVRHCLKKEEKKRNAYVNPSTQETEQGGCVFGASLGSFLRSREMTHTGGWVFPPQSMSPRKFLTDTSEICLQGDSRSYGLTI